MLSMAAPYQNRRFRWRLRACMNMMIAANAEMAPRLFFWVRTPVTSNEPGIRGSCTLLYRGSAAMKT
jgi:hypothetical protein